MNSHIPPLISDATWDPSVADNEIELTDIWYDALNAPLRPQPTPQLFNKFGEYNNRTLVHTSCLAKDDLDQYF